MSDLRTEQWHAMVRVRAAPLTLDDVRHDAAGLHPDLIRRLVALGIVEASYGTPPASCGSPVASSPWWPGCSGFARAWGSTTRPSRW